MADKEIVLITGVSNYWGFNIAKHVQAKEGYQVIGIDRKIPKNVDPNIDFIQADLQNPLLHDLIKSENVSIVCHLAVTENSYLDKDKNNSKVTGTINLFKACKDTNVHAILFKSSSVVYGAHSTNSAFISEENSCRGSRELGFIRELLEIESFIKSYNDRYQFPKTITLRFANIIGPTVDNYFTQYLKLRVIPVLWGFNPRVQVIHETDVVNAILHGIFKRNSGTYNIAADGIVTLNKLIGMCNKTSIPTILPALRLVNSLFFSKDHDELIEFLIESSFLKYSYVTDIQNMRDQFGYMPSYTSEEAIGEFSRYISPIEENDKLPFTDLDVELLRDTIERRKLSRENKT